MRVTSSLADFCNGLLDRDTGCPPHNLLALEFVVLLLERVDTATKQLKGTLESTKGGTAGQHGRETLDCDRLCESLKSSIGSLGGFHTAKAEDAAGGETTEGSAPCVLPLEKIQCDASDEAVCGCRRGCAEKKQIG